jgi:hypothetical protein
MVRQFKGNSINSFTFHTGHEPVQSHRIIKTGAEIHPGPLRKESR